MNHELTDISLSGAGRIRRDSMRGEMIDAFVVVHRARRARRRISASLATFAVMLAATWVGARLVTRPGAAPAITATAVIPLVETISTPIRRSAIDFAFVGDGRPSLVTYVDSPASLVQIIDDEALVEELAQMNRPAGLIEIGGSVRLTRSVVDDDGADHLPLRGSGLDRPLTPGNRQGMTGV